MIERKRAFTGLVWRRGLIAVVALTICAATDRAASAETIRADEIAWTAELSRMCIYYRRPVEPNAAGATTCRVNGNTAEIASWSVLPVDDGEQLVCIEAIPPRMFSWGGAAKIELVEPGGRRVSWSGKAVSAFFAGLSQYDYHIRALRVSSDDEWLAVTVYNESDFTKQPAVIDKVLLDGVDITARCRLPSEPLPPDMHRYVMDERVVYLPSPWAVGDEHEVEFVYHMLPGRAINPQADETVFRHNFRVRKGLSFPIGGNEGPYILGCVCVHNGGLRQLQDAGAAAASARTVRSAAPDVPVYVRMQENAPPGLYERIVAECDFVVAAPPISSRSIPSAAIETYFQYYRDLYCAAGLPFLAAVGADINESGRLSPQDVLWLAMAVMSEGAKGITFNLPDGGWGTDIAACNAAIGATVSDIARLGGVLSISHKVELDIKCNRPGVRAAAIQAGPDRLVVFALNEWCTRASRQMHEPFHAAGRQDVRLAVRTGPQWIATDAYDLATGQREEIHDAHSGLVELALGDLAIARAVVLERRGAEARPANLTPPYESLSDAAGVNCDIEPAESPFIDLGKVETGQSRELQIPVCNHSAHPVEIVASVVSDDRSRPAEVTFQPCTVAPGSIGLLKGSLKALDGDNKSVTHLRVSRAAAMPAMASTFTSIANRSCRSG